MQFNRELTYEEWESVGAELFRVDQSWQWWVGDWINYGEKKYGQTYEQALALTDKKVSTLWDVASISRDFETSRRREVSWGHHRAVQGLEPEQQDEILEQAEKEGKSRQWVRDEVKKKKNIVSDEESNVTVFLSAVKEVMAIWERSDEVSRKAMYVWISDQFKS